MAYNGPGLSGTGPPLTKWSRGVGALTFGLPHRETVPAAPLIGTPLLHDVCKAGSRMPIRGARKEEKRNKERKEDRHGREGVKKNKVGKRREKQQQSINSLN